MKQSFLVQSISGKENITKPSLCIQQKSVVIISSFESSISTQPNLSNLFKLMQIISTHQQIIQTYKQFLTQKIDFNPQSLFQYISCKQQYIDKKHFITLFEQNQIQSIHEDSIKLYFHSYGYKDKINYSAFLNLIYPVDVELLKYIGTTGIKKYANHIKVTEEILAVFLLLIKEEINLLEKLDTMKNQLLPKIIRKEIKLLMRLIKKNGQCKSQMEIQSQNFLKYQQLKTLFRKLLTNQTQKNQQNSLKGTTKKNLLTRSQSECIYSTLQKNLPCIFRKLSMGKNTFINFEDLQFWLKPWTKNKNNLISSDEVLPTVSNIIQISGIKQIQNWNQINIQQNNMKFPLTLVSN